MFKQPFTLRILRGSFDRLHKYIKVNQSTATHLSRCLLLIHVIVKEFLPATALSGCRDKYQLLYLHVYLHIYNTQ